MMFGEIKKGIMGIRHSFVRVSFFVAFHCIAGVLFYP
jgi:hypothetical protein